VLALAIVTPMAQAAAPEPVGPKLTPKLRDLLREEMRSVSQAVAQIATAIATGSHGTVADAAQKIHDSFILERKLTAKDKADLERAVPAEFLALDGAFHQTAAKLAEVARHRDSELETFYFGRMLDQCQSCHGRFATDRFPGLAPATPAHGH